MPDYIVDVYLTVKVPVSAPSTEKAEAMALRQLTVKLNREATDTAVAIAYNKAR
jgi:hypothetical protein